MAALSGVDVTISPSFKSHASLTHSLLFLIVDRVIKSFIMPLSCFAEAKMTFALKSDEIKILLPELQAYGGAGPESTLPLLFIKTTNYFVLRISVIFLKMIKA